MTTNLIDRPPNWEQIEARHRANVGGMLLGPRRSNWQIRRAFVMHRKGIIVHDTANERDAVPAARRAFLCWMFRSQLEEVSRAKMAGPDRRLLESRNKKLFGSSGRTIEGLLEEAKTRGAEGESDQLKSVINWAVRPDIYYVLPHPNAFGCTAPDVQSRRPRKPERADVERPFLTRTSWSVTTDPVKPWAFAGGGKRWEIRVNDFPEEQLFTLLAGCGKTDGTARYRCLG